MSRQRTRARRRLAQGLYQWQMAEQSIADIEAWFLQDQDMKGVDLDYFRSLLHDIPKHAADIDAAVEPLLDRPTAEVDPVERAVLRLGAYELMYRPEIPYKVVINEAVECARAFGGEGGHAWVNSVLDGLARSVRSIEMA